VEQRSDPNFPSLFRWVDDSGDFKDEKEEVTRISTLAELRAQVDATSQRSLDWEEDENDTKVIRVIHHDATGTPTLIEELEAPESAFNPESSGLPGLETDVHTSSFNLSDMDFETDSEFLEEEDAGLIVMTRQEVTGSLFEEDETLRPMRLVDRVPPGPEEAKGFGATDPTIPRAERPKAALKRRRSPAPRKSSGQKKVFLAMVLVLGVLIASLGGWKAFQSKQEDAILQQTLEVIGGGDYQALLLEEARLSHALDQGSAKPIGAHMAAFGLVELALWGDFSGGRPRWEAAVQAIRDAGLYGANSKARSLTAAFRAFFQGDLQNADRALVGLDNHLATAALLRGRVAMAQGEMEQAMGFVIKALELEPHHPSALLTKADLCIAELDADCARAAIDALQEHAGPKGPIRLLRIRLNSMDEVAVDRAGIIEQALALGLDLAPRQVGRVRVRLAELYALDGNPVAAKRALEAALAADSESAAARFALGVFRLREGRIKQALSDFRACVRSRPADQDCHSGVIHSLLELDRVEEARLHVLGNEAVLGVGGARARFSAWLDYAGEEDPETVVSHLVLQGPREKYIVGLAHGRAGRAALAESVLIEAAEGLHGSGSVLDLWMAPRAFAAAARFGESEHRERQAELALSSGASDPMVLIDLGWYRDSIGQKEEAVSLFDQADQAGSESALTHFNRGWYFLDFGDKQTRTKASWIRYRDLNPSGSRAERVMSQLLDLY
jgi:tetratricopeptide (TPR) repeat protein